jgi:hypothetical protein
MSNERTKLGPGKQNKRGREKPKDNQLANEIGPLIKDEFPILFL